MRLRNLHVQTQPQRPGTIVPMLALSMTVLLGVIALAIDIGMIAVARTQVQGAADIAALTGARILDGDDTAQYSISSSVTNAKTAATYNKVLTAPITTSEVAMRTGVYKYNAVQQKFVVDPTSYTASSSASPPGGGGSWTASEATIATTSPTYFARVFGVNSFNVGASAVAVHRPRDIALILDYSGSMMYSSEVCWPPSGDISGSLNPDPVWPKFGHWSRYVGVATTGANPMQRTTKYGDSGGENHSPNNLTTTTPNGPPFVQAFYCRNSGGALVPAFHNPQGTYSPTFYPCATPAPDSFDTQTNSPVAYIGDRAPLKNKATTGVDWAKTVDEVRALSSTSNSHVKNDQFEGEGYGTTFKGYSMGPGYYGKTFWHWPPDPRTPSASSVPMGNASYVAGDWRKRFFYKGSSTTARLDDNSVMFDTSGFIKQASSSTYQVDYPAVLKWIKAGPQVFPPNLRAGRVVYYNAIPDDVTSSTNLDQIFWKKYIDTVLGVKSANNWKREFYGRESTAWGTTKITAKSALTGVPQPYMHYRDNPARPRAQFWFGPLTMMMFLSESNDGGPGNMMAGTLPEAQTWQLKAGINSALEDVKKNHPNDWLGLIYFSGLQEYNTPRVKLGQSYSKMKNALFFPLSLVNAGTLGDTNQEVRPYNTNFEYTQNGNVPNARGSTCPEMGFMLAYNEFSGSSGNNGRRGASKMVVLETDGVPNTAATGGIVNNGAYQSYYNTPVAGSNVGNGDATVLSEALLAVNRLCALDSASPPGYSTSRQGVKVHVIAFGDLFESSSSYKPQALDFLADVQVAGGTSPAGATTIEPYKIIVGDYTTRIDNLRTALERIMQSGIQVSLIK